MRSFLIILAIIIATLSTAINAADCPEGVRVRKDFRDMPIEEWNEFLTAMKIMRETRGQNGISQYEEVIRLHAEFMSEAHADANFGFWHRILLKKLEDSLRAANPRFKALPYWNWSADYALPHKSRIWDEQYLGGSSSNGFSPQRSCVPTGPLAGFMYNYPNRYCLSRGFSQVTGRSTAYPDGQQVRFHSPPELTQLITNENNFPRFHDALQYSVHSVPHIYIGGVEGEMFFIARSPADPAFFLHHAFVDLLLDRWQRVHNTFGFPEASFNAWAGSRSSDAWNLESTCVTYQPYSAFQPQPPLEPTTVTQVPPIKTPDVVPSQQAAPSTPVIPVQLPSQATGGSATELPVTTTASGSPFSAVVADGGSPTSINGVPSVLPTNAVIPQVPTPTPPQITTLPSSQSLPSSVSNLQSSPAAVNSPTTISTPPQSTTLPSSQLFSSSVSNPQSSPVVNSPNSDAPQSTPIPPATIPTTEQSQFNKDTFYNTPGCPYLPPPNSFLPAPPQKFIEKNMYPEDKVRITLEMVQKITRAVKEQAQKGIYLPPIVKKPSEINLEPQNRGTPLPSNVASSLPIMNGLIVVMIAILMF